MKSPPCTGRMPTNSLAGWKPAFPGKKRLCNPPDLSNRSITSSPITMATGNGAERSVRISPRFGPVASLRCTPGCHSHTLVSGLDKNKQKIAGISRISTQTDCTIPEWRRRVRKFHPVPASRADSLQTTTPGRMGTGLRLVGSLRPT